MIFYPSLFQVDFEQAVISAIEEEFPRSQIRGCFFHFTQCIWRNVQNCGLQTEFSRNREVEKVVRRLSALPLLPEENITDVWIKIHEQAPDDVRISKLLDYALGNWIHEIDARFKRSIWNHFDNEGARTNNHLEGWHSGLNKSVGPTKPNVFKLIGILKFQQEKFQEDQVKYRTHNPPESAKPYREIHEKICRAKALLAAGQLAPLDFVDEVGYLLHYTD